MVYFKASFYFARYSVLLQCFKFLFKNFNWRLLLFSILLIVLYFLNQFIHIVFRLIDAVFYSGFRKQAIKEPVFIIANPRSGTTYLHRLISLDGERFAYTKFAHTFFVTTSFIKFANAVKWVDRKIGDPAKKLIASLDSVFYKGWDDIHAMGFNKAEEDELPFAQTLTSPGIFILFPFFHLVKNNHILDNDPPHVRKAVMDFYVSCVKRFVYAAGQNKTYLAKNVMSSGRIKSIMERFPDAKVIYIARHPYDSVPSGVSMFSAMYNIHTPKMADDDIAKQEWARLGISFYKQYYEMKKVVPASQFYSLKYEDLIRTPKQEILNIYKHYGWEVTHKFEQMLDTEQALNREYKSAHEYSLEQFGLTKEGIYNELYDIMDEFGFDKEF
jgi:hypothetical protein